MVGASPLLNLTSKFSFQLQNFPNELPGLFKTRKLESLAGIFTTEILTIILAAFPVFTFPLPPCWASLY